MLDHYPKADTMSGMKLCAWGLPGLAAGKHNLKDPRFDAVDKLVEASKKVYAQVDVAGQEAALEADALLTSREAASDLILQDLEFIETRLGRNPPDAERVALVKMQGLLESEKFLSGGGLGAEELQAVAAHAFLTTKPVVVATEEELQHPEALVVRAFHEAGYITFLTVGGKENRAWPIKRGLTALEAAGSIHTDLQKGFIRAEVIALQDLLDHGGETQAKRANKLRLETKTYVVQDCDIVNFRFTPR